MYSRVITQTSDFCSELVKFMLSAYTLVRPKQRFSMWPLGTLGQAGAQLYSLSASDAPRPILIRGAPQTGKTCLVRALSISLGVPIERVTAASLAVESRDSATALAVLAAFARGAAAAVRSHVHSFIVFFDDAEVTFSDAGDARAAADLRRAVALGCARWNGVEAGEEGIGGPGAVDNRTLRPRALVIAATAAPTRMNAVGIINGWRALFPAVVNIVPPTPTELLGLFRAALRVAGLSNCDCEDGASARACCEDLSRECARASSFCAGDVAAVVADTVYSIRCSAADLQCDLRETLSLTLRSAIDAHVPLILVIGRNDLGAGGMSRGSISPAAALEQRLRSNAHWHASISGVLDFRGKTLRALSTDALNRVDAYSRQDAYWGRGWGGGVDGSGAGDVQDSREQRGSAHNALSGLSKMLRPHKPAVSWSDVSGLERVAAELRVVLRANGFGGETPVVSPPTGVLLYGPPGTGKSLLARAAAGAVGARFIYIPLPELVRSGVGDSERALFGAFEAARAAAPALVFFDEVDALFPSRQGGREGGSGGGARSSSAASLTSALLAALDSARGSRVVVLAATNAPHALDAALFSPGRFDRAIHVGLPDALGRSDLLSRALARAGVVDESAAALATALAAQTDGFSGADLVSVVERAVQIALKRAGILDREADRILSAGENDGSADARGERGSTAVNDDDGKRVRAALTQDAFFAALHGDAASGLAPLLASTTAADAARLAAWRPLTQMLA